jgi:hypothetical protein
MADRRKGVELVMMTGGRKERVRVTDGDSQSG